MDVRIEQAPTREVAPKHSDQSPGHEVKAQDSNTSSRQAKQGSTTARTRRLPRVRVNLRGLGMLLVGIFALAIAGSWLHFQFTHVFVDDARVAADMISVSSRVPGWVTAMNVIEGDRVLKGKVLVTVDDRETRLAIKEIDARLAGLKARQAEIKARMQLVDARTQAEIRLRKSQVEASKTSIASAVAQFDLAQAENQRSNKLIGTGAVTRRRLDQASAALVSARQEVLKTQAELKSAQVTVAQAHAAREELKVLKQQLAQLGPEARMLQAQRGRKLLELQDRTIVMPFDGVVDKVFVDNGEYVMPGQRVLMVHSPQHIRVEANVRETDIRFLRLGKVVKIKVDALPGEIFKGKIERIGQATTSEFALLPNPNPSGNFTKISQRLHVRVGVEQRDGALKPGMMVEIEVPTNE